jgi:UDP-N-acetylmuramate: L-alanyl-gamma-D-glutamyl-meso-diaminopimelate ligase
MKVHFIAIGGSAMHSLALALLKKGYHISGSDDEIFEPSKSRLAAAGILPENQGWDANMITKDIDAVILGMHARNDNPELLKARELGLKIYSYPEFLYEQTKDKIRVVIGGSHGKTTITSMVMHVLSEYKINFDYMVGAQLEGFDNNVQFLEGSKIAVFEGDEYLSSTLDPRPKFHIYKPNIALISGIAWDHINVFSTFDVYVEQFKKFINCIEPNGSLVYCADDPLVSGIALTARKDVATYPYNYHPFKSDDNEIFLLSGNNEYAVHVFGKHNMQNISGAKQVCNLLGINDTDFYKAISSFKGASKRLQLVGNNEFTNVYFDFAHSPSKLTATVRAVKEHFPKRQLIACMELHTFSSLSEDFLKQYYGTMERADLAFVYFNPHSFEVKKLKPLKAEAVAKAFSTKHLTVFTSSAELVNKLKTISWKGKNLLLMSSGNFDGLDFKAFTQELLNN